MGSNLESYKVIPKKELLWSLWVFASTYDSSVLQPYTLLPKTPAPNKSQKTSLRGLWPPLASADGAHGRCLPGNSPWQFGSEVIRFIGFIGFGVEGLGFIGFIVPLGFIGIVAFIGFGIRGSGLRGLYCSWFRL